MTSAAAVRFRFGSGALAPNREPLGSENHVEEANPNLNQRFTTVRVQKGSVHGSELVRTSNRSFNI